MLNYLPIYIEKVHCLSAIYHYRLLSRYIAEQVIEIYHCISLIDSKFLIYL